jgi:hypothetical protein
MIVGCLGSGLRNADGCAQNGGMLYYVRDQQGTQAGPLTEQQVRAAVALGQVASICRDGGKAWVAVSETPFAVPLERFADLSPRDARALIINAVAIGTFQALTLAWLTLGLLAIAFYLLKSR